MKKTQLYLLAFVIAALGVAAFVYKWKVLHFPLEPVAQTEIWELQARVEYEPRRKPNSVVLQVPDNPPGYAQLDENIVARGYTSAKERTKQGREVRWVIRRAEGRQVLYYRSAWYRDGHAPSKPETEPPFPTAPTYEEPQATAIKSLLDEVFQGSADSTSFASVLIRRLNERDPDEGVQLLVRDLDDVGARARFAVDLLATRQIAARVIYGFELGEQRGGNTELQPYLQVYDREVKQWNTLNARTGIQGWPDDFFLWTASSKPLVEVERNPRVNIEFTAQRVFADALETAKERLEASNKDLVAYSLLSLPLQAQQVYRILLLVPLGAFIMLILRNIVGIKTFGTFMPVLIALAFNWTGIVPGVILFATVISLGLLVRFYMERLKLLLVPRLTAVLIVVVLLMALVSVVSNKLGFEVGLNVALFPMIILTMTIERVSVAWEERGAGYAIRQALGSLVIASLAYLVMGEPHLQHLLFVFPELLLVLFALTLVLGRYSGYRLTELFRFRALARDPIAAPATAAGAPPGDKPE
jgi:hypothetical protein